MRTYHITLGDGLRMIQYHFPVKNAKVLSYCNTEKARAAFKDKRKQGRSFKTESLATLE